MRSEAEDRRSARAAAAVPEGDEVPRPAEDGDNHQARPLIQRLDPDRLLFTVAGGFAVWTVLCHVTVLLGGSLDQLIAAALAAEVVTGTLWWLTRGSRPPAAAPTVNVAGAAPPIATPAWLAATTAAAGLAASPLVAAGHPLAAWTIAVAAIITSAIVLAVRDRRDAQPPAPASLLVWVLAVAMALVAALANRPDIDDALYLNLAVSAVDRPSAPLLAIDHMHGVDGVPLDPPTYRFYTLEPALAAASRLTGIAPIVWAHLVLPPFAAILMVLAWARLIRILTPRRWRAVLLGLFAILVTIGNTHAWYGNVGLVRLHQGKCVFASVAVPLLLAVAADLARTPDRRRLGRLAVAVLASIGLTGTALWLCPVLVAIGLVTGGLGSRHGLRAATAAAVATSYPVLLGVAIAVAIHTPASPLAQYVAGTASAHAPAPSAAAVSGRPRGASAAWRLAPMRFAVSYVLGDGALPVLTVLIVVGLWWLSPEVRARRLAVTSALVFLAVFFNPISSLWLADHVTGRATYWRGFWLLPVPLLLALVATSPVVRLRRHGQLAAVVAVVLLLVGVTKVPLLGPANHVRLAPCALKVPQEEYAVARRVSMLAPAGAAVIAPQDVAAWITTFRHHPCPLLVRRTFFAMLTRAIPADDARRRGWAAEALVTPRLEPEVLATFADALARYRIAVVVLPRANPNLPTLQTTLSNAGYTSVAQYDDYQVWRGPRLEEP